MGLVLRFQAAPPNILIIVVDTLRADQLGDNGRLGGARTPFLDRLAAQSVVYDRAYAASSWTLPSILSLFTARYPSEHGVNRVGVRLPDDQMTLAEVLRQQGFRSAGFISNQLFQHGRHYGKGFDRFDVLDVGPTVGDKLINKADADAVNRAGLAWLDETRGSATPYLLYLHYMEPHMPYRAHPGITAERPGTTIWTDLELLKCATLATNPAKGHACDISAAGRDRLADLYAGEVAYADQRIAELMDGLAQRDALANTIVVLTSDHGEEFGEHGGYGHGRSLFEAVSRVPLVVRIPGEPAGRISAPVEMAGLGPALLRELAIAAPRSFHVAPLPVRPSEVGADAIAYSELLQSDPSWVRLHEYALQTPPAKLLAAPDGGAVAYDVRADALERTALAESTVDALRVKAQEVRKRLRPAAASTPVELDSATKEHLRRLGYLGDDAP
jgi:arylsulfatase